LNRAGLLLLALVGALVAPGRAGAATDARVHFDRALAASNEQRFTDALDEFEAAYAAEPDFRVLYNIGRVSIVLGKHVRALDALEQYLREGGANLPEDRRAEVSQLISDERLKVATLVVETTAGADVRVDGRLAGTGPLRVLAGSHTLEALVAGRPPLLREVELVGGTSTTIALIHPPAAPAPAALGPEARREDAAEQQTAARARTAGYTVGAVGLVAMAAGAVLAFQGMFAADDARARLVEAAMPAPPATPDFEKYDAAKIDYDDARTRNRIGWTIVGVGAVAAVAGTALVIAFGHKRSGVTAVANTHGFGLGATW
jgi:tetratricopeptide (TPR) repeat protein